MRVESSHDALISFITALIKYCKENTYKVTFHFTASQLRWKNVGDVWHCSIAINRVSVHTISPVRIDSGNRLYLSKNTNHAALSSANAMQWLVWAAKAFSMQSYTHANAMRPVCSKGATSPIDTHRLCEPIETANTQTITDIKTVRCPNASYGTDPMCNLSLCAKPYSIYDRIRASVWVFVRLFVPYACALCICLFRSMSVPVFVCDCSASQKGAYGTRPRNQLELCSRWPRQPHEPASG